MVKPGALLLAVVLAVSGCADKAPKTAPSAAPTPIARLDSAGMHLVRVAFCDLVPKDAVRAALLGAPTRARTWRSGDRLPDAGGQVGHEFGCRWTGAHGAVARVWVFARPVSTAFARTLIRAEAGESGCRTGPGGGFGSPSELQTCVRSGTPRRVRRAGLFTDTWLTCEVAGHGSPPTVKRRADAWCVSVASSLDVG